MIGQLLALDDDEVDLDLLRRFHRLSERSCTLACFADADELVAHLAAHGGERPCVTLIDIRMSPVGGFDIVERIRREVTEHGELVLFTTSAHPSDLERAAGMGIDVVSKPSDGGDYERLFEDIERRMAAA